jgi:hypothetical protein
MKLKNQIPSSQTVTIVPSVTSPLMVHPVAYEISSSLVPRIPSAPVVADLHCMALLRESCPQE